MPLASCPLNFKHNLSAIDFSRNGRDTVSHDQRLAKVQTSGQPNCSVVWSGRDAMAKIGEVVIPAFRAFVCSSNSDSALRGS